MQNNSNDSTQGWKQRLDEFEDISGNDLDLNKAWERLQQKKNAIKPSRAKKWYWLAAACITAMLFTLAALFTDESQREAAPAIVKADPPKPEKENTSFVIQNTPGVIEDKQQPAIITQPESKPGAVLKAIDSPEPLLVKEDIDAALPAIHLPDTIATQPLPVATTIATKKLKVVHINELNQPQQGIATEEGKPYFPITYQTKEVYTNAGENDQKRRDNIIRIKLN